MKSQRIVWKLELVNLCGNHDIVFFNSILDDAKQDMQEMMGVNILQKSVTEIKQMQKVTLPYRRKEIQNFSPESENEVKEKFPFLLIPNHVSVISS